MKVLGVCNANDSGASLIVDGEIVACANEERFSRRKNHRTFPRASISFCLEHGGLRPQDIDHIGCGAWGGIEDAFLPQLIEELLSAVQEGGPKARELIQQRTRVAVRRDAAFRAELEAGLSEMGFDPAALECHDHHLSHAATAFYPSPFDEALVVTMDSRGDFKSATVSEATREGGLELRKSTSMYDSVGTFYGFITRFLGFTPDRHEGKVTGLAAFGDPEACLEELRGMIECVDGRIRAHIGPNYTPFLTGELPSLEKRLSRHRREDIAAGAQRLTEEIILCHVASFLEAGAPRNLCLAGGVFANVKVNQRLREHPGVKNLYVFPQMGDGGNALGGALLTLYRRGGRLKGPLESVFLGPSFRRDEVLAALRERPRDLLWEELSHYSVERIAREISEGAVVGLFRGRMEYGPRALGGRSILARATDPGINFELNRRLHRTEFMPFAPVTLEEAAPSWYEGWGPDHIASRFMTVCYPCTERARRETPAIVHVDGTARPQVLAPGETSLYGRILSAYHALTGIPTLINTSFNNHEEPIIATPRDALDSLALDNVDYVVLEDLVVRRR